MNFVEKKSKLHAIRQGDPKFMLTDGFITCPRAGFEIHQRCPENYRDLLQECIGHGWIRPVAHVTERELLFIGLTNNF